MSWRGLIPMILLAAGLAWGGPLREARAASPAVSITQTVRNDWREDGGVHGRRFASYTALGLRTRDWDHRASLSWTSWRDGGGTIVTPDGSGPGSIFLSTGRRAWSRWSSGASATVWLRLKAKIPLQADLDVTGTGTFDWGASLFASARLGRTSIIAEYGRLHLGGDGALNASSFSAYLSHARRGARIYPLAGFAGSSPLESGQDAYGEWSLGLGVSLASGTSITALYGRGTTALGPRHAVTISVRWTPG